jgi:hypothetical protein
LNADDDEICKQNTSSAYIIAYMIIKINSPSSGGNIVRTNSRASPPRTVLDAASMTLAAAAAEHRSTSSLASMVLFFFDPGDVGGDIHRLFFSSAFKFNEELWMKSFDSESFVDVVSVPDDRRARSTAPHAATKCA